MDNGNKPSARYAALVDAASTQFLQRGYHGVSLFACAEAAELPAAWVSDVVDSKAAVALSALRRQWLASELAIQRGEHPFSLPLGAEQALLAFELRTVEDVAIDAAIRDYYGVWQTHFLSIGQGHRGFWQWLGFWLSQQLGLNAGEQYPNGTH